MRSFILSLAFMAVVAWPLAAADDPSVVFKLRGSVVRTATLSELRRLVPEVKVTVFEYQDESRRTYLALPLRDLFDHIYGPKWKDREDALFTCTDGYTPVVPLGEVTTHSAYLAFGMADGKPFSIPSHIHDTKHLELGPFYLIWDNLHDSAVMSEGPNYWPYELASVDLIDFSDRAPKLAPPRSASSDVKDGFTLYRQSCMACHTLNGTGGATSGVELNLPHNVTEYYQEGWLEKWIEDPRSVREGSKMPAFRLANGYRVTEAQRKKQVAEIIAYLKAMAGRKL